jgi:hypothetical protein
VKAEGRMMNEEAESKAALGQKQKMVFRYGVRAEVTG